MLDVSSKCGRSFRQSGKGVLEYFQDETIDRSE